MRRDGAAQVLRTDVDRRIASGIFIFIIAAMLAGFAKNFYLRAWLGTRQLIPTAWLHGFIMSAWLILFVIQVLMVAHRRVDLHLRLGLFGAALAVLVIAVGRLVAYMTHQSIEITVLALMTVTVLICVAVDSLRSDRIHRASFVPGILIVMTNVATCVAQLVD
jgi:predicted neutral ceramidase superfamily lipid hydrolase